MTIVTHVTIASLVAIVTNDIIVTQCDHCDTCDIYFFVTHEVTVTHDIIVTNVTILTLNCAKMRLFK